jgi:signal transduction histidine kinase
VLLIFIAALEMLTGLVSRDTAEVLGPAKGVILAICLLSQRSSKPWILSLAGMGLVLGQLPLGVPATGALLSSAISIVSVAIMSWLTWRYAPKETDFSDWRTLLRFFGFGIVVATCAGVPGSVIDMHASRAVFFEAWLTWSFGTLLSFAILTPPLVLLGTFVAHRYTGNATIRIVAANALLLVTLCVVFGQSLFPLTYLVPPALLFVAFAAEIDGVALGLLLTAMFAISSAAFGIGPTAFMRASVGFRINTMQFFLVSMTMTLLPTAAAISAQRRLQVKLSAALARAESAVQAKTEFLATVSHELRTPLSSVIGFAEALSDYCNLDARALHYVERVRTASRALLSTVNGILDQARFERGEVELHLEYFSLREFIQETLEIFVVQAQEKGLELKLALSQELNSTVALADPNQLRQILLNLIGNAIKFTDQGSVTLSVLCSSRLLLSQRLRVEIRDTGRGIEAADTKYLFLRSPRREASVDGGSGLGLAICQAIVSKMGGEIGALSEYKKGSTFWFEVPIALYDLPHDQLEELGDRKHFRATRVVP